MSTSSRPLPLIWSALGLAVIVCVQFTPVMAADASRFVQDRFAIGAWVDPPLNEDADKRYAEIVEAHFNLLIGGFESRTPEQVKRQLELCEKHGLKALPLYSAAQTGDTILTGPACWGYFVRDEPPATEFPTLHDAVAHIRKTRPGHLGWINLFPNYANPEQMGATSYEDYVRRFVDDVDVDVLCMDHYPFMSPEADTRDNYCANLEVMRKFSLAKSIPFWNFFNALPFDVFDDPTEAQIRWQVFSSIVYGARGVLYFCYWTPNDPGFPKDGGIITMQGRRTRHYEHAKRLNAQLQKWGPTLMKLTSTGVYRIRPTDDSNAMLADTRIRITKGNYLIGLFRHTDGRTAAMINNYHFAYTQWPTVEFKCPIEQVREVDPDSGTEVPVRDVSPALPGLQLSLDAADCRLFLLPRQE